MLSNWILSNCNSTLGRMEKPEFGTGSGAGNRAGNGTGTGTGTRTYEIKIGDVSVLRVSLTITARSRRFIPTLYLLLLLYFLLSHFLRTAQNFSSRISYTRERCKLGS